MNFSFQISRTFKNFQSACEPCLKYVPKNYSLLTNENGLQKHYSLLTNEKLATTATEVKLLTNQRTRSDGFVSTDLPIHRSTDPTIYRSSDLPIPRSIDPSTYRFSDLPIQRFIEPASYPSSDLLIHRSTDSEIYR